MDEALTYIRLASFTPATCLIHVGCVSYPGCLPHVYFHHEYFTYVYMYAYAYQSLALRAIIVFLPCEIHVHMYVYIYTYQSLALCALCVRRPFMIYICINIYIYISITCSMCHVYISTIYTICTHIWRCTHINHLLCVPFV